jgi:chlorobactene glucosyltransferase
LEVLAAFLVLLNLAFALRGAFIALHSKATIVPEDATGDCTKEFVSIIVPARNEERNIERCVRSLGAQRYGFFEIIVVDDRSEDTTASILERLAKRESRLRLLHGACVPAGWVGKPWALEQGTRGAAGSWLLFTDADTDHDPLALQSALSYARANDLDALSVLTDQELITFSERAILPSILWTILFACGSLDEINDPGNHAALFNGQYILMRRGAYETIGGHETVRSEIAEDLELARRVKEHGALRSALVRGAGLVRTRMYRSFGEIWNGFVKNFALGARGRPFLAALGVAFFACVAPVTPLMLIVALAMHAWIAALLCGLAMAMSILASAFAMQRFRLGAILACALPLGITVMVAIFVTSVVRHATGGVTWRGRRYGRRDFDTIDKTNSYGNGG